MERFGRYVLLERVAHGGMAEVFRAASVGADGFAKLLAIKRILPHLAAEKAFVTMLVDEAKIAATLAHPNILQVLDLGRVGPVYFIAMEFVAGQALNHVVAGALRQGFRLPPAFTMFVVGQALRGLAYAHDKLDTTGKPMGIIHRDVSPQNIMVGYDGSVRLADFGIAKAAERSTQTLTGSLKGKPAYMSPEQVQGKSIDQRVDVYAMGVVLHELVAMRRMRKAQTDVQILMDVAKGEFPTFEQLGVTLPSDAAEVVYRALSMEPEGRWPTATAFADACDEVCRHHGWHFTQQQVAQVMGKLFPKELERELSAQTKFQALVNDLAGAQTGEISQILQRADGPGHGQDQATPTPGSSGVATLVTPPPPGDSALSGIRQVLPTEVTLSPVPPPAQAGARHALMGALGAMLLVLALGGGALLWMRGGGESHGSGQLIISTQPPGASVTVGGKQLAGVTPLVADNLPDGPVELVAQMPGMLPLKDVVQVQAGNARKVSLVLQPRVAQVRVITSPAGAHVSVNGAAAGSAPVLVDVKGPGPATVRVEMAGYIPANRQIDVDDPPAQVELTLVRRESKDTDGKADRDDRRGNRGRSNHGRGRDGNKGSAAAQPPPDTGGEGMLTLQSRPWARIFVDGKDIGRFTPAAEIALPAGKHSVKLVNNEEDLSAEFSITIKAGETLSLSRELH